MFLDRAWPEPGWRPERPKPRIGKRGEKVLAWIFGFNLLMLLLAPIGGGTLIDLLLRLVGK